jgi:hypothetical protein
MDRLADSNDYDQLDTKLNAIQKDSCLMNVQLSHILKKVTVKETKVQLKSSNTDPTATTVSPETISVATSTPVTDIPVNKPVETIEPKVDLSGMYREAIAEFNDRCSHLGLNLCVKTKSTIPNDDLIPSFIHTLKTTFTELFEMLDQPAISFMDKYSEYFPRKNKAYSTGSFETILKNNGFVTVSDILRFSNDTQNAWYTQHRVFFHDIVSCLSSKHIKFCDM